MTDVIWVETDQDFDDILNGAENVVVDFTAPGWCRPCQQFAPHFERAASSLADSGDDTVFVAVDVDKAPWAMQEYGVQSVPTVKRFVNGEYVSDLKGRTVVALLNELK